MKRVKDVTTEAWLRVEKADAAWDAALMAHMYATADLAVHEKHRVHARARWEVWTRGYGLLRDVGGVLYVYRRP